jgi:hypothetical protein
MKTGKFHEVLDEFRTVVMGRSNLLDSLLPPLIFLVVIALLGFQSAMWGSLAVAGIITAIRLRRRQPLLYALGGIAGVVLAILLVQLLGRSEGYFLPGIITGGLTVLVCAASAVVKRPAVAWTSYIARRWPLDWYWHPRVRPAYSEVTWLWAVFFAVRWLLQLNLFRAEAADLLAVMNLVMGWPATILLLIVSYLYGTWRLRNLGGPSVEEFKAGAPPPWQGQQRGF